MTTVRARDAALGLIRAYRRRVSPYKRYGCACRVHEGRASCSALGERAIRRWGVVRGSGVLRARLAHCGDVHRRALGGSTSRRRIDQRGDCDPGCDGCDLPGGSTGSGRRGCHCSVDCCSDCGSCEPDGFRRRDRELHARIGPVVLVVLVVVLGIALPTVAMLIRSGDGDLARLATPAWWIAVALVALVHVYVFALRRLHGMTVVGVVLPALALAALAVGSTFVLAAAQPAGPVERVDRSAQTVSYASRT